MEENPHRKHESKWLTTQLLMESTLATSKPKLKKLKSQTIEQSFFREPHAGQGGSLQYLTSTHKIHLV